MRKEQIFTVWLVDCHSLEACREHQRWLSQRIDLNYVDAQTRYSWPGGVEKVEHLDHRLGDYFASIRLLPAVTPTESSFRLVFERLPNAPRYWKDLMVHILRDTQRAHADARITVDYKGDEEPATAVVTR